MVISNAEKKLRKDILNQYIFKTDLHDKYYLIRQIGKSYPEIPITLISKTVNRCTKVIKTPMTKNDFVRFFLDQLLIIFEEEFEL